MNILLSNDDGIHASGIRALVKELSIKHDVYVVAPDRERSAAGHSLTLHSPLRVDELEPFNGAKKCWSTSGTPGDCVKIAISAILTGDEKPDFVISGINHGANLGTEVLYSGTVSCAIEGSIMGVPSISMSLANYKGTQNEFEVAAKFASTLLDQVDRCKVPPRTILNVNVPAIPEEDITGIEITELGNRMFSDIYEKRIDPRGKTYYWMAGEYLNDASNEKSDVSAIINNKISITPVCFEMTNKSYMTELKSELCLDNGCDWF